MQTSIDVDFPGIMEITGPDTRRLLQGQCTADLDQVTAGTLALGGLATPKGRLYANFYIAALSDQRIWLLPPRRQVPELMQRFAKYAAFFKVEVHDRSAYWQGSVFRTDRETATGQPAPDTWLSPSADTEEINLHCPLAGVELSWRATDTPDVCGLSDEDARALAHREILAGIAWVLPETTELFLPQSINWDQLGGVSFSKGCYTGQEVIARLHHKGSSKRRLQQITGTGEPPLPGSRLRVGDTGKAAGDVARILAGDDGQWEGLAVINGTPDAVSTEAGDPVRVTALS